MTEFLNENNICWHALLAADILTAQLTNNEAEMTEFLNENNIPIEEEAGVMFTLERYVLAGTFS